MNPDHALALLRDFVQVVLLVSGPPLLVALVAGVAVGIVQTATQINEASLSYLVKVVALVLVVVVAGPALGGQVVGYARRSIGSIGEVVR